jgi:hypothetical protein
VVYEEHIQAVWYNGKAVKLYWEMPSYILVPETLNQIIYFKFSRPFNANFWFARNLILDFLYSNHGPKPGYLNFLIPSSQVVVKANVNQSLYLRGQEFSRQSAYEGGKVASPTHRPPLPPRENSFHFC